LVAALLAFRAAGESANYFWLAAVGVWAFGCGLRGILWHQLADIENDQRAAVPTFAVRHSAASAARIAKYIAMPIEIIGLAAFLAQLGSILPLIFLALYGAFVVLRQRRWGVVVVVARPQPNYSILGHEYYGLLLPISVLVASALMHPADWLVVPVHLLLFAGSSVLFLGQAGKLLKDFASPYLPTQSRR
jgi:hypothetical protein